MTVKCFDLTQRFVGEGETEVRVRGRSADPLTFMTQFKTPWVALSNCPDVWF